jgi:hypothetical protein
MKKLIILLLILVSCGSENTENHQKFRMKGTVSNARINKNIDKYADVRSKFLIIDNDIKWRIFEENINDTLRIYRNRIFAKYGYNFNSEELKKYFNSQSWYKINPDYNDSLIIKKDSLSIQVISKYEQFLSKLTSDSVEILKKIFDFRDRLISQGFDTTIIVLDDITGDLRVDKFITRISFEKDEFKVENKLLNNSRTLWSNVKVVSPCFEFFDDIIFKNYSTFGYYFNLYKNDFSGAIPRVSTIRETYGADNYIEMKIVGNDTTYEAGQILYDYLNEDFKKYLFSFKGLQIIFPHGYCIGGLGVGYDVKIWDKNLQSFVTLWSGP